MLRFGTLALISGLLLYHAAAVITTGIAAGPEVFQDPYPVDSPTPFDPYPVVTGSPTAQLTTQPTSLTPSVTFTITTTPSSTATLAPDLRSTEDAEVGSSLATPAASASPAATITLVRTATAVPTPTPLPAAGTRNGWIDWGFFALGFAVPLLGGCGFVLYWLDRRPDLFSG